jgi:hypothetical protein
VAMTDSRQALYSQRERRTIEELQKRRNYLL